MQPQRHSMKSKVFLAGHTHIRMQHLELDCEKLTSFLEFFSLLIILLTTLSRRSKYETNATSTSYNKSKARLHFFTYGVEFQHLELDCENLNSCEFFFSPDEPLDDALKKQSRHELQPRHSWESYSPKIPLI